MSITQIWKWKSLSRVQLFATPRTVAHHVPLSFWFFRQEYWSGLPCPPPEDLPNQGWNLFLLCCLHCWKILYHLSHQGRSSPNGSAGKGSTYNAQDTRDMGSIPGWKDPLEEEMAIHSSILAWKYPMNRGAWWATVQWIAKSQTWPSN